MLLRSMFAENYRSLRSIRMDLTGVNLFIGENGVGKSNLYRALQLVQSAVRGKLAYEIAKEGGMSSALWSGPRRAGRPVRIRFDTELLDEERAITFRYRVEAGLRPPSAAAGFAFEPQVKEEELSVETGSRPAMMMKRSGPGIFVRGERRCSRRRRSPFSATPAITRRSARSDGRSINGASFTAFAPIAIRRCDRRAWP